jgi:V/A-type H+-transporting ATPase subunit I
MIRPRKMKQVELTVLDRDVDQVIEFLGRRAVMHLSKESPPESGDRAEAAIHSLDEASRKHILDTLEKLKTAAAGIGVELPGEPEEASSLPGPEEEELTDKITGAIALLAEREKGLIQEKEKVAETLNEAKAFANLNAPFSDLDQLSYLTLRIGRLDPGRQEELRNTLADRAVIIPLGSGASGDRVLAAASRKGRFALDSELKRQSFVPIAVPEGYKGVPGELLSGLEDRMKRVEGELETIAADKARLRTEYGPRLRALAGSYLMAAIVEQLKVNLVATKSVYVLTGWVPADMVGCLVSELEERTGGRIAVRTFNPEELVKVKEGREKVPVSLEHGAFVKGFEGIVFSYGAPLYGTIDPTPFVALFFTILFGIMFGDVGQGFVLLLAGILTGKRGLRALASFRHFSVPLIAVGISSMVMGCLNGAVFTNETLLIGPTRAISGLLTGHPADRFLTLMPLTERGGSVTKLFYFFGFTIAVGVLLNSLGLLVNIVNQCSLKSYEKAFFSKTGLAGLVLFWYAVSIAIRYLLGDHFRWFDLPCLFVPALCIFFGPLLWRLIARERPYLEHGVLVFIMEGFVEVLETASTYVSNTVSFLRVGAFALSHAVLSFIIFELSEMVLNFAGGPAGSAFSFLIMIVGNGVIILLEGMIVAIQVVRLQYYEFFSKFFTETGVEFAPFRFRKAKMPDPVRKNRVRPDKVNTLS